MAGCLCKKPAPGLLHQAARALQLGLSQSWMVGDVLDDVEAGRRASCRTVLLDVGHETAWRMSPMRTPHERCGHLLEAAQRIVAATQAARHDLTQEML
jgi:D-glycero-D-manno-heptose 1,7-bisphosphate phosphatase